MPRKMPLISYDQISPQELALLAILPDDLHTVPYTDIGFVDAYVLKRAADHDRPLVRCFRNHVRLTAYGRNLVVEYQDALDLGDNK